MREMAMWRALVFGCLAAVSTIGTATDRASIDKAKISYQHPSSPSDSHAAERDPVWRLGRSLFFEPALSASGHVACASCHTVAHAWSDAEAHPTGDSGLKLALRTPTLFGLAGLKRLGWTGRFRDIAAVTTFAITSPTNMAQPLASAAARLREKSDYPAVSREAFGSDINGDVIVRALAVFVNSVEPTGAPFDRWIAGDDSAVDANAKRGFSIFVGKGQCSTCHAGPSFTDGSFHDIGASSGDSGRGEIFKSSPKLQHAFKTPSLRGVADRAPYMHNGSFATLDDVIELYDRGGIERQSRADEIKPLHLTTREKADLVAFLKTLSGDTRFAVR